MPEMIIQKCISCGGPVFEGFARCAYCGTDLTKKKRLSKAFFYPAMATQWGKAAWRSLRGEGNRFFYSDRISGLKGITGSVNKILNEGEIADPLEGEEGVKRELTVDITDRTVTQNGVNRVLLKDIKLTVSDGEMVLILGGSGAGKTTFLNAVMGSERANARVTYGGIDMYEQYGRLKHYIGYVPQSDPLRKEDTVYMTLQNAAELKLPGHVVKDAEELNKRINEVLAIVGLTEEAGNMVKKLSGGQRKRLSIAAEYIAGPHLFFLDEPDSGLDGAQAKILMENLRTIADTGKIVMVISHVPDRAAQMYDKVLVLAKDKETGIGGLSYFGTVKGALKHYRAKTLEEIVAVLEH